MSSIVCNTCCHEFITHYEKFLMASSLETVKNAFTRNNKYICQLECNVCVRVCVHWTREMGEYCMCVCLCVCVGVWTCTRVHVCVCVCVCVESHFNSWHAQAPSQNVRNLRKGVCESFCPKFVLFLLYYYQYFCKMKKFISDFTVGHEFHFISIP